MRASVIVAGAAAALAVAAGGGAAVPGTNGPIFFVGSRARTVYPEIYSVAADGSGRVDLSSNPAVDEWPAASPNGKQIAFVSDRDGYEAVYVMNADGTSQHRLCEPGLPPGTNSCVDRQSGSTAKAIAAPTWAPSGGLLAFTGVFGMASVCDWNQHYAVDPATGQVRLLGQGGYLGGYAAEFSPGGRFIALQSGGCKGTPVYLVVLRVDTGAAVGSAGGLLVGWAPRGQRLLRLIGKRDERGTFTRSYLAMTDASGRHRWVLHGVPASAPVWSPGGRTIAFFRDVGRHPGLYVVRAGTRHLRRLVAVGNGSAIAWSPSGTWLAFSSSRGIYIVRSNGRGLRRIGAAGSALSWSRNSSHLAFIAGDGTIRVVNPPNTAALRVSSPSLDATVLQIGWAASDRLLFASSGPQSPPPPPPGP